MDFNIDLLFPAHSYVLFYSTLFLKSDLTKEEQLLWFVHLFTINDEQFSGLEICRHAENKTDPNITLLISQLRTFLFCENHNKVSVRQRLMAALTLIVVHST